ncbi:MAG TPA: isochorismatase family protein [Planctomycetaceae bacterium]|nr:isochorismatase family protein [Planctomycetaceae bacterium]
MTDIPAEALRHCDLLDRRTSRLVFVDVQEKLRAAMPDAPALVAACRLLGDAARLFDVPVWATEQYPKGLEPTVAELRPLCDDIRPKQRFSAAEALALPPASEPNVDRDQIVLAGVETHVCVAQTALDLLSRGYRVWVVADAVASRRTTDRHMALARLRDVGVTITTVEAVVFEWCETADDPQFRTLSALVKQRTVEEF